MIEAEVRIESDDSKQSIKSLNDLFDQGYRIESLNVEAVDSEMIEADITLILTTEK